MMNKDRHKPGRIPVRFVDEDKPGAGGESGSAEPTPEEIGRQSSYEDETEVKRRIDRGAEEGGAADEADVAGGPASAETPERREDQDTNPSHRESDGARQEAAAADSDAHGEARRTGEGGPALAELVATRAELKRVEAEAARFQAERADLLDKLTRRQADFENYRKRVERERAETYNRAVSDLVAPLLPVVDNLRRALDAESLVQAGESKEFRHFLQGVELIYRQLNSVLENLGITAVPTVGEPFDPHVHEAVATVESDEYGPDTVTEELARGYRLGDKLIRPAMVKVAK
jgi:molecular chaperone GrpE